MVILILPGILRLVVAVLVVVDSVVVGGPMACEGDFTLTKARTLTSLHHLVTDLYGLQAGDQHHQMYTDMQMVTVRADTQIGTEVKTGMR